MKNKRIIVPISLLLLISISSFLLWWFVFRYTVEDLNRNMKEYISNNYPNYYISSKTEGVNNQILNISFDDKFDNLSMNKQYKIIKKINSYFEDEWDKLDYEEPPVSSDIEKERERLKNFTPLINIKTDKYTYENEILGLRIVDKEGNQVAYIDDTNDSNGTNDSNDTNDSNNNNVPSSVMVYSISDDEKIDAWVIAQNAVKDRLKAPSTADFPMYDESFVSVENGNIVVKSYVDAQNSFGAMLRSNFVVTLDGNLNVINVYIE